jgi:hypothetical protein
LIHGCALGGIAVICRNALRVGLLPRRMVSPVTALHFVDVLRPATDTGQLEPGALIVRCDTSSRVKAWLGSTRAWQRRYHARFRIVSSFRRVVVECDSDDRQIHVAVAGQPQPLLATRSWFGSTNQLMQLLRSDLFGLRLLPDASRHLPTPGSPHAAQLIPLQIQRLESSLFEDSPWFPRGTAVFDSAYWVRADELVWGRQEAFCGDAAPA